MNKFIQIGGINHPRFVGMHKIFNIAVSFDKRNIENYRTPKNQKEFDNCVECATRYYATCKQYNTAIDKFHLVEIAENILIKESNQCPLPSM